MRSGKWDTVGGSLAIAGTIAFVLGMLWIVPAFAADKGGPEFLAVPKATKANPWNGPYIAIGAGYLYQASQASDDTGTSAFDFSSASDAAVYGGAVGINVQMQKVVLGAEFSYDRTNAGNAFSVKAGGNDTVVGDVDIKSIMSLMGRVGFLPTPNTMVFVQAGYSWVGWSATLDNPTDPSVDSSKLDNPGGLTLGAGIETMLQDGWAARLDYRFIDLGSDRFLWNDNGGDQFAGFDHDLHIVKLNLVYRFK